jgi:hypothetical protein
MRSGMLQDMLAALILAAICLQPPEEATCLDESALAGVGDQLLNRVVPDSRDREQAAFLTRDHNGDLGCRLWPLTTERSSSTYWGRVPEGTVAIIHTHPHEWSLPSRQDGALSAKLRLPVLVVTHGWLSSVDSRGQTLRWVRWRDRQKPVPVCEAIEGR